jgi:hypothetical protein
MWSPGTLIMKINKDSMSKNGVFSTAFPMTLTDEGNFRRSTKGATLERVFSG